MHAEPTVAHPSDEAVAAYLERVLPAEARASLEAHLAECEPCRDRLMLASEVRRSAPAGDRRARWLPLGLAAGIAAGLIGILALPGSGVRTPVERSEFRAPAQELEARHLRTHAPPGNATVAADSLRLTWSSAGTDVVYQVTVSGADGRVLWSTRLSDTTVTPPAAGADGIRPGERYFWRVDALLPDLRTITTGEQPFRVAPP